jgi:hypothetical protein
MAEYIYNREIVNGHYNIDNPDRKDAEENQIYLAKEIEAQISKKFKVVCNAEECKIIFEEDLTEQEKNLLDTIVENHKNNT